MNYFCSYLRPSNYFLALSVLITNCTGAKNDKAKNISTSTEKPNIIYILADDLGYGDLRSLNPDSRIPTPNMDKIVREGVNFTDAYSSSAICTHTRYGILTGRYAFRTRLKNGVLWGYSTSLIESARTTVASFLKDKGYQTACIGKWHLGIDWSRKYSTKAIPDFQGDDQIPSNFNDNVDYIKPVKVGPSDQIN